MNRISMTVNPVNPNVGHCAVPRAGSGIAVNPVGKFYFSVMNPLFQGHPFPEDGVGFPAQQLVHWDVAVLAGFV